MPSATSLANLSWRKQLWQSVINVIFPPACANCEAPGTLFCDSCRAGLIWVEEPICRQCGRPDTLGEHLCPNCRGDNRPILPIRAACLHAGSLHRVIHRFKYENQFGLADLLAAFMVQAWPQWQVPVEVVVPVALHPERERKRGYNQATLLAQHLARKQGWTLEPAGLIRIRHTRPQVGLTAPERRVNVHKAFQAESRYVAGKQIMLVDDVCTTGATLTAAAAALYAAGAANVNGYCLAHAKE
jgi:ComF family protein